MIEYLITFAIVLLATRYAEININKHNVGVACLYSAIVILLPSALAGVRDSGVGWDTEIYGNHHYDLMRSYSYLSIKEFWRLILNDEFGGEKLYFLWIFISVKLTGDIHLYYFSIQFFICLFTYISILHNRKNASMVLMEFVFLFLFYNLSLNIMRQSMALAFALFSYRFFIEKRWLIFIPLFVVVCNLHNSGFFYVIFLFFAWLQKNGIINYRKFISFTLCIPFLFVFINPVLMFVVQLGLFPQKFIDLYMDSNDTGLMKTNLLFGVILYLVQIIACRKIGSKEKEMAIMFANNHLLYLMFYLAMLFSFWAYRVSFYFYYFSIFFIPMLLFKLKQSGDNTYSLIKTAVIVLIVSNWYLSFVVHNETSTVPYESEILDKFLRF